jgi:hypothetical protein
MTNPMMMCGHAANATMTGPDGATTIDVCAICAGIDPGASVVDTLSPSLDGRVAVCAYCKKTAPSSTSLPFFGYRVGKPTDSYYDGCKGWD